MWSRDDNGQVIGVKVVDPDGNEETHFAAMVVDATGRDALSASKNKWRNRDPKLNKISIWTIYEGAKRDPGLDAGATTVAYLPEKGWFLVHSHAKQSRQRRSGGGKRLPLSEGRNA